jgi:tetratricopeptide (TPR) repeat protein
MSQSILPGSFSVKGLSVIERRRLEYYYEQYVLRRSWIYGEGHFILACYAALPVVLTPDLLYKLWLNFKDYWWEEKHAVIHPVAPADLLLSPLVEEIGPELYEMPESIRQVLLLHLKEITSGSAPNPQKLYSLSDIAQFLHSYAQYDFTPANKNDDAFREAQIWTALSYLDPGQAFGQLVNKYKQAKDKSPDQLRYANALGNMSRRFMLDIVHDPAQVPQAHKAVTALTSVVKDVLNDRDPGRLAELQREIQASDDEVLTDVPVVKENVINIEIDEMVTAKLGGVQKKKGKGKLRALVVGLASEVSSVDKNAMNANVESAELFAELLRDKTVNKADDFELMILLENNATKHAILDSWNNLMTSANIEDDLLFYVSGVAINHDGHCLVACADTDHSSKVTWLADEEIGHLANSKQVASITMIIQTDHAATDYWLDTKKNGNVVFAACKYGQEPLFYAATFQHHDFVCGFTVSLERILRYNNMQITNRGLFVKLLYDYAAELRLSDEGLSGIIKDHSPTLLCNANTLDQLFAQGNNKLVKLQTLLRDAAFYNEKITGEWDSYTARCLSNYIQYFELPGNLSKQRYIEWMLKLRRRPLNDKPIFLFIFSDPDNKLTDIEREHSWIMEIMSKVQLDDQVDIHQLHNPDTKEFSSFFKELIYRDQIQLIYYSGFDKEGNFLLKDGAITFADFAFLTEYQKNIQLFVSNTCRSEYFAEYVSMLGVPQTIGVKGEISDQEGADFGIELFKTIVAGGQLGNVRNLGRPYLARENGFVLYKKDPDAVLPWKFKEEAKKIKAFISYAPGELTLINTLKDYIKTALPNIEFPEVEKDRDFSQIASEHKDFLIDNDVVLACISPRYVSSEICMRELQIVQDNNIPIVGIDLLLDNKVDNLSVLPQVKLFARLPGKFWPDHFPVVFSDFIGDLHKDVYSGRLYEEFLKELAEAIEKSLDKKKDTTVFIAHGRFPSLEKEIFGREELLLLIDQQLSPELPLLLHGIVGIGKTTAAIAYCNNAEYIKNYNYIIWADASEGILFSIAKALEALKEFRSLFKSSEHDQNSILPQLKTLLGNSLLVIDNANNRNDLLAFTSRWIEHKMETRCLIISRCNISGRGLVRVDPLSLANAVLLYRKFNQKAFQEESFEEIYNHVTGNVLLLELLAKFSNSSSQIESTAQLLQYLRSNASAPLFDDPAFANVALATKMYNAANLDKDLEDLIRPLSLFPDREFSRQLFFRILGEQQAVKMEALILAGWLEQRDENYKIPFIVKEIFRSELKPDAVNCLLLITRLSDLLTDQDIENKSDLLTIGVSIVKEIGTSLLDGVWMDLGKLQLLLGRLLLDVDRLEEGIDVVMRSIRLFTTLPSIDGQIDGLQLLGELYYKKGELGGSSHAYRECQQLLQQQVKVVRGSRKDELLFQLIIVYHKIGSLHYELKEYETAIKSYTDALQLNKTLDKRGLMADWIIKLGIKCYEGIGEIYQETERHELALVSFEEGFSLLNKWGGFDGADEIRASLEVKIKQTQDNVNTQENPQENFLSEAELFSAVERSGKLTAPDKPLKSLLLFQTKEDRTWLIATTQYVFIISDDKNTRKSGRLIQRQIEKNDVLSIETKPGEDENYRCVKFADQGIWWFYSLSLFSTDEILLRALGKFVSDQKIKKSTISDLQLKVPLAQYIKSGSNNVIRVNAGKQEAFIVDRTLVCFAAKVTVQQRRDVLDLLLFAQLVARKDYPEMFQAMEWHRSFTGVLTNIGCTIDSAGFSQFAFSGKTFRLENIFKNMMAAASAKYRLTWFLEKSLSAVKSFSGKKETSLDFKANTHSINNAIFQACLVANTEDGLELNLGVALITGFFIGTLFDNLSTENASLDYSTLSCKVNEQLYANVRDVIIEKIKFIDLRYIRSI